MRMVERFDGPANRPRLVEALRQQKLVCGDTQVAEQLASAAEIREYQPGDELMRQGDGECCVHFILAGKVRVMANDREVALRIGGDHVGEMAAIDPAARRSATVTAEEPTVTAVVPDQEFLGLVSVAPAMALHIARELAHRLRQRNRFHRNRNARPFVFIGSSSECLAVANTIRDALAQDPVDVRVWEVGVFQNSHAVIEDLLKVSDEADFAVLVLGNEDTIISRGQRYSGPRDNVVFELGLFMGAIGRERALIVRERAPSRKRKKLLGLVRTKPPTKTLSDLLGVTTLNYEEGSADTLSSRLACVCQAVRNAVAEGGTK